MRFATQTGGAATGDDLLARAKRLEAIGYDTIAMPDHMVGGAWSTMPALGAVAVATTKIRLGNLVLDNDFRNPAVLARELATLDVVSNGRVEIGIGAGWLDRDYLATGIAMDRAGVRGATPHRISIDGAREQLAIVREAAGDRFGAIELSQFLDVTLTDDRDATIRERSSNAKSDPEVLRRSMYAGIGTLEQVRAQILRIRREIGITYFCLRGPHVEELAPIVRDLAGT